MSTLVPNLSLSCFLTNIYTEKAATCICCPVTHYHASHSVTNLTQPRRTLKKGNIATFLLVARINIWQYLSAADRNTFIHLFAGSPSPLSINGTTQRTAKGRRVSYMLINTRVHMEKTLISKRLPGIKHSKGTLCKFTKGWFVLYLFCCSFFCIFSSKPNIS